MAERDMTIPKKQEDEEVISLEESNVREKVFFEDDDYVSLRDGRVYQIPPLSLKEARKLMKSLNTIDTSVIIANLMAEEGEEDNYDQLMDVLLMAFKPYHKDMTKEYLGDYIDLVTAKKIIDSMIGLNGLKKLL